MLRSALLRSGFATISSIRSVDSAHVTNRLCGLTVTAQADRSIGPGIARIAEPLQLKRIRSDLPIDLHTGKEQVGPKAQTRPWPSIPIFQMRKRISVGMFSVIEMNHE
jgi:hypothetical protein